MMGKIIDDGEVIIDDGEVIKAYTPVLLYDDNKHITAMYIRSLIIVECKALYHSYIASGRRLISIKAEDTSVLIPPQQKFIVHKNKYLLSFSERLP
jgi:hypothetical protein